VRAALFARRVSRRDGRVLVAAGAVGALAASRALVQAILLGAASLIGIVPLWPVLGLAVVAGVGVAVALVFDRRGGDGHVARLVQAVSALAGSPRLGIGLVGWAALAAGARAVAAASIASAVGVRDPLVAALAITAALAVAAALPLTPGGIGITSGAVSLALASRGIGFTSAFAAGVIFHAVETATTLAFAGVAIPLAARPRLAASPALRVSLAAVAVALLVAAATPSAVDLP